MQPSFITVWTFTWLSLYAAANIDGLSIDCHIEFDSQCNQAKYSFCDTVAKRCRCLPRFVEEEFACRPLFGAFCDKPGAACSGLNNSICGPSYRCFCVPGFEPVDESCMLASSSANRISIGGVNAEDFRRPSIGGMEEEARPPLQSLQQMETYDARKHIYSSDASAHGFAVPHELDLLKTLGALIRLSSIEKQQLLAPSVKVVSGRLGSKCYRIGGTAECTAVENAICGTNGVCVCKPSGFRQTPNGECARLQAGEEDSALAPLGERCFTGRCAAANSFCDANRQRCSCVDGYVEANGQCAPASIAFTKCTTQLDCQRLDVNSECVSAGGYCSCLTGYVLLLAHCYPKLGSSCSLSLPCGIENSYCSPRRSICECKSDYIERAGECVHLREVMEAHGGDTDTSFSQVRECNNIGFPCWQFRNTICSRDYRCVCADGFQVVPTGRECMQASFPRFNDSALYTKMASSTATGDPTVFRSPWSLQIDDAPADLFDDMAPNGNHVAEPQISVMQEGAPFLVAQEMTQFPSAQDVDIPTTVASNRQFHPQNLELIQQTCPTGSMFVRGQCVKLASTTQLASSSSQFCRTNDQCQAKRPDTVCVRAVCRCKPGSVGQADGSCLPLRPLSGACRHHSQCSVRKSTCSTAGICTCVSGYTQIMGLCFAGIGRPCSVHATRAELQCGVENSMCQEGVCRSFTY